MMKKSMAVLLLSVSFNVCCGQEAPVTADEHRIVVKSRINQGTLRYRAFYKGFGRLLAILPPAPRFIEPVYQMSFTELPPEQEDGFLKPTWNVAIVDQETDIDVPMIRGGYFVLPALEGKVSKDASILFNSQTRKNFLRIAWKLRLRTSQSLAYADITRALQEVNEVQKKIPWYSIELRAEKHAKFDAIKACFAEDKGELRLDDQPLVAIHSANCRIYRLGVEPASAASEITFSLAPEIVVLEDSSRYRSRNAGDEG